MEELNGKKKSKKTTTTKKKTTTTTTSTTTITTTSKNLISKEEIKAQKQAERKRCQKIQKNICCKSAF